MKRRKPSRLKTENKKPEKKRTERKHTGNRASFSTKFINMVTAEYDFSIIMLVFALTAFGIVMVFSAGYYQTTLSAAGTYSYLIKQTGFAAVGFAFMFFFARVDYHVYMKCYKALCAISVIMLALIFSPMGITINGATRWINLVVIHPTPSEYSKLAMIIFTACFLAKDPSRAKRVKEGVLPLLFIMVLHAGMIIKQPNLSTALVVCAIMVGIMFIAGLGIGWIVAGLGSVAVLFTYIINFRKNSHWYARLTTFVNPFADAQGDGYQVSQSLIALGNGGFKGLGLGNSIAKNLYLPEPMNDFILAIIGEELGFIGIAILMCVYLILIYRCLLVAANAKDKLGMFLASGVTIMLALQVIINVAVVTASMPATGITLPFVSYGGTSIIVFMIAMGILLNVSKKEAGE